jgi:antitoxin VapB
MGETAKAKLFMHGRSQAVRLPKEFRMPGTEVEVHRDGDTVVLKPLKKNKIDWEKYWAELAALGPDDSKPFDRYEGLLLPRDVSFDDEPA